MMLMNVSGYTSSSGEDENDKTQIEFLLLCMMKILGSFPSKLFKQVNIMKIGTIIEIV